MGDEELEKNWRRTGEELGKNSRGGMYCADMEGELRDGVDVKKRCTQ